jgi:TRAP-type mannitol/chloroaromatic compound transport system permease large subunit
MGTAWRVPLAITGRLLFVAVVSCYLLGRIFAGAATPIETVVYGAAAAFGVEFLLASWRDLWRPG